MTFKGSVTSLNPTTNDIGIDGAGGVIMLASLPPITGIKSESELF